MMHRTPRIGFKPSTQPIKSTSWSSFERRCCCHWMTCLLLRVSSIADRSRARVLTVACAASALVTPMRSAQAQRAHAASQSLKKLRAGAHPHRCQMPPQMPSETSRSYQFVAIDAPRDGYAFRSCAARRPLPLAPISTADSVPDQDAENPDRQRRGVH